MFEGSFVALVTPFTNGAVDLRKIEDLTQWHIEKGTNGIVPCGTTGESCTLTRQERADVIKSVLKVAKGKAPVIAGTGTNSTAVSIELTRQAKELGADAALLVTPYYNKPPQEGLFLHYQAISDAVDIPQILYNVPGRTGVSILPETTARLAKVKNVVAIKEATGRIEQVQQIRSLCEIAILSGEDALTYPILCLGGKGVISVAANIIPTEVAQMCAAVKRNDLKRGEEIHNRYDKIFKGLFMETNPIPVKAAMEMMGLIASGEPRLPLCPISEDGKKKLAELLKSYELI